VSPTAQQKSLAILLNALPSLNTPSNVDMVVLHPRILIYNFGM